MTRASGRGGRPPQLRDRPRGNPVPVDELPEKWRGYVAEEALAIATYSALSADDFVSGVRRAVNHSGNSDATGAICGALLGTHYGPRGLPQDWLEQLEARRTIELLATDFARIVDLNRRPTPEEGLPATPASEETTIEVATSRKRSV